jgi:hypothetical protein
MTAAVDVATQAGEPFGIGRVAVSAVTMPALLVLSLLMQTRQRGHGMTSRARWGICDATRSVRAMTAQAASR